MSKRSNACDISDKVKKIVWDRDNQQCVICHRWVSKSCANAHYIKRSQGGLGIPENIVTLCPECHHEEDNGLNTSFYEELVRAYLHKTYGDNWLNINLKYDKWGEYGLYSNTYRGDTRQKPQ